MSQNIFQAQVANVMRILTEHHVSFTAKSHFRTGGGSRNPSGFEYIVVIDECSNVSRLAEALLKKEMTDQGLSAAHLLELEPDKKTLRVRYSS